MKRPGHGEWSLTEAARLLGEPQHRLIYMCEKDVIQADVQQAEGRGSSRRFSARNLLEFGVALRLRTLGIPVSVCGAVVFVLRGFERSMGRQMPGFRLPQSLLEAKAPELKVIIGDDQRLYFTLGSGRSGTKTGGGGPLQDLLQSGGDGRDEPKRLLGVGKKAKRVELLAKVEVSITGIAQDLRLGF